MSVQKLYSTSCQNKSVIGNFMKRLCTCLISMAISIAQISFELQSRSKKNKVNCNFIFISIEKTILETSHVL